MTSGGSRALQRPTTFAGMMAAEAKMCTEDGLRRGLAFRPNPSDVIITPFAKSGTTWMQQIVHGLRTGGSMAFDEISEVVPWIEMAHDLGQDLDARQFAEFRAFKSHLDWAEVPKGARYIVVFRDPADVLVSMHRFLEGWTFEVGSISLAEFARKVLSEPGEGDWFTHTASWWRQSGRHDVLRMTYDRMQSDLTGVINAVADFIDPGIDAKARRIATDQASFDFMKRHATQFDDHLVRDGRAEACGLPTGGGPGKVNLGKSGEGAAALPTDVRTSLDEIWAATMKQEFGFSGYPEFARAVDERFEACIHSVV